jgi:5'-3' exonuclease
MGIPFYFRVIAREHPDILCATRPACSHLYVDFNGMIHQAAQRVIRDPSLRSDDIETAICDETWKYLEECVDEVRPQEAVHICVDGVAPVAKMSQQRKRRYLSMKRKKLAPEPEPVHDVWDTNAITPGTAFMAKLQARMEMHIGKKNSRVRYSLSAADEPGEGEHKIFADIASTMTGNGGICIYGLDADLIMLSLMANKAGIYLMRETDAPGQYTYLNIDKLREGILASIGVSCDAADARDVVESYLAMCFLLGNDFLPHITSLSLRKDGHGRLLKAAKVADAFGQNLLVSKGSINLDTLLVILRELQKDESDIVLTANEEYLKRGGNGYNRNYHSHSHSRIGTNASTVDPDTYPLWPENKATKLATAIGLAGPAKWRGVYYKHCFDSRINDTKVVVRACMEFLTGVQWTYAYYKRLPKNCGWLYPYSYAPCLIDLANTLQASGAELARLPSMWKKSHPEPTFVHPDVQLLCVLPPESIPANLRQYVKDPAKGLAHLYPTDYHIKTYLHGKLWECAPVLPPIDVDLVVSIVTHQEQ